MSVGVLSRDKELGMLEPVRVICCAKMRVACRKPQMKANDDRILQDSGYPKAALETREIDVMMMETALETASEDPLERRIYRRPESKTAVLSHPDATS